MGGPLVICNGVNLRSLADVFLALVPLKKFPLINSERNFQWKCHFQNSKMALSSHICYFRPGTETFNYRLNVLFLVILPMNQQCLPKTKR